MKEGKSLRIRESRWKKIEKKAWDLSMKAKKMIKPTDLADALLAKNVETITLEEIEEAIKSRKEEG